MPRNDSRWSRGLVGTITLWVASQPNPWVIRKEKLAAAIRIIWDIMFPEIRYSVTLDGSIMGIVSSWLGLKCR